VPKIDAMKAQDSALDGGEWSAAVPLGQELQWRISGPQNGSEFGCKRKHSLAYPSS